MEMNRRHYFWSDLSAFFNNLSYPFGLTEDRGIPHPTEHYWRTGLTEVFERELLEFKVEEVRHLVSLKMYLNFHDVVFIIQ